MRYLARVLRRKGERSKMWDVRCVRSDVVRWVRCSLLESDMTWCVWYRLLESDMTWCVWCRLLESDENLPVLILCTQLTWWCLMVSDRIRWDLMVSDETIRYLIRRCAARDRRERIRCYELFSIIHLYSDITFISLYIYPVLPPWSHLVAHKIIFYIEYLNLWHKLHHIHIFITRVSISRQNKKNLYSRIRR